MWKPLPDSQLLPCLSGVSWKLVWRGRGRGTGEAGRKLSKDVGSAGDWLQLESVGTPECTFAPPEARGPALCPCVSLTVGSAPQSGGVAWPWRGAAEGSSPAMGSSVLCRDSQQLGNCCPAGHRTSGWDTHSVHSSCVPLLPFPQTKPRRRDLVTGKLMLGEEN